MAGGRLRTQALLLRRVEYGESDLVVTLLTEAEGKRSLFARGARKSRKRFTGALEPFRLIEATYRARSDDRLARLEDASVVEGFDGITGDLHRLCWASLALEWTAALALEGEPSPVFDTSVELLRWLGQHRRGADEASGRSGEAWYTEVGCLRYALVLLDAAGVMPQLSHCVRTGRALETLEDPAFSLLAGGLVARDAIRSGDQARSISEEAVSFLLTIARGRFPQERDREVLREARGLLVRGLAELTERDAKSLSMLKTVWI